MLIFIAVIDHGFDTALNDRFGTFVTRKQCHIQLCSLKTAATVVQDRIELTVCRIKIFVFERISLSRPRKLVIRAAHRESVITHRQNLIVIAHDARAHLRMRIFGTHPRKHRHTHKILIPTDIIVSLVTHVPFPPVRSARPPTFSLFWTKIQSTIHRTAMARHTGP